MNGGIDMLPNPGLATSRETETRVYRVLYQKFMTTAGKMALVEEGYTVTDARILGTGVLGLFVGDKMIKAIPPPNPLGGWIDCELVEPADERTSSADLEPTHKPIIFPGR